MTEGLGIHHEKITVGLLVLMCSWGWAFTARAQVEASSAEDAAAHLNWAAPEGCPSELEVRALVQARLRARTDLLVVPALAEVEESGGHFEVRLRATEVERHFDSPSCASVARAVALVFATWVVNGPESGPVESTVESEGAESETAESETAESEAPESDTLAVDAIAPIDTDETGRASLRFVGQLLPGFDAFATPNVEPTIFATFGLGVDVFEVDLGPLLLLGISSWGFGGDRSDRFFVVGARLRVGMMFELDPQWELGGHLLSEVAWLGVIADGASDDELFATFGAGLEARFYPIPSLDLGLSLSIQAPFPLRRSALQLPSGLGFELDWATLVMALGVVVRIS